MFKSVFDLLYTNGELQGKIFYLEAVSLKFTCDE